VERGEPVEPLAEDAGLAVSEAGLPGDTIAVDLAEAARVEPPFMLTADGGAAGGLAVVLPKDVRTAERTGRVRVPVRAPAGGEYAVWLRVRWRDECSNSISVQVGAEPERDVGNDVVFGAWHWVAAGVFTLKEGENALVLREREDGVALDQVLLTRDAAFQPTGRIEKMAMTRGVRRFADDFSRSPGHGLEGWEPLSGHWEIHFSFDPNRIPNQYALSGAAEGPTAAVALVKGPPWRGARLSFAVFPERAGRCGVVLDRVPKGGRGLELEFSTSAEGPAALRVTGAGVDARADLTGRLRLQQWHEVVVERWAWVLSVYLDGEPVLTRADLPPAAGAVGLTVASGAAFFDDVKLEEMPWQADDGQASRIPWKLADGAAWFRGRQRDSDGALVGRSGAIRAGLPPLKVETVLLDEVPPHLCGVACPGLGEATPRGATRLLRRQPFADSASEVSFTAPPAAEARLWRVAIGYRESLAEEILIGPYTFSAPAIADPSDYLDFTRAEYEEMRRSPEAAKLRRGQKMKSLIGSAGDEDSPWYAEGGRWWIEKGRLVGRGPTALLRYADEIGGAYEVSLKVRLPDPQSEGQILLCGGPGRPHALRLVARTPEEAPGKPDAACVVVKPDGEWHALCARVANTGVSFALDGGEWRPLAEKRADGSQFALGVSAGRVEFDDIEFRLPRRGPDGRSYSFQQPETDWWREGGAWVDHGGIACVLASSWISLLAPRSRGLLWNKHSFGGDVAVTFGIGESSEWHGWDRQESHTHHPFDNICVVLGTACDAERGYRLEVNSQQRRATVLYRNGVEVARVAQDGGFPIQYQGGHAPYSPRRNRIGLLKRRGELSAVVNGREVLRFTDPQPLEVSRVGLGGYETHINFSHVHIRQLER
jgi:hypothetical protein